MNLRTLFVSAGLFAIVCGGVYSQPQPLPLATPENPIPARPPIIPPPSPPVPVVPAPPKEKSVEELLDELERIQTQKAELAKKELELKATIRKRVEKQLERLNKLGIDPKADPDRVGRIWLKGNDEKDEKKILDTLGLFPGQILQYPKLEEARKRLEKAGFAGVMLEITADSTDSPFKDIMVTIPSRR
ncbi:MAG: hypothetical protein L0241_16985 [Planctomycetia bacterium]|nr:hypothetical protein [Planctomycetia bacterium]